MIDVSQRQVRRVGGPIRVANALSQWSERRGLLVEIRDGGLCGVGETSPLSGFSGSSLPGLEREIASLLESGDRRVLQGASKSARFAIETAELDLEAQKRGTSIAALLAGQEPVAAVASELLGDPRQGRSPQEAIRVVKFKVGPMDAWSAQRDALAAFSRAHRGIALRLDFNGSLDRGEASSVLREIEGTDWSIDFIEDPVASNLDPVETSIDIAIDAMVVETDGIARIQALAASGHAQLAVLKPALLGGLRATHAIALSLAANHVVPIVSHLLDGPVALAACAELAAAVATSTGATRAAGVGPHPALAAYGNDVAIPQCDGGLLVPRRHGLGVRL